MKAKNIFKAVIFYRFMLYLLIKLSKICKNIKLSAITINKKIFFSKSKKYLNWETIQQQFH